MTPKLLANENFPAPSILWLRDRGLDVFSVTESACGATDADIMAIARREGRWVLTFDRDYGELVFARHLPVPPAVLLLRLRHYRPDEPGQWIERLLATDRDLEGMFVVIDDSGWRKRPLPDSSAT